MSGGLRFLVTSVIRRAGQQQASGFARVLDWESQRVLMKSAVPESAYRTEDPNPRGGLRGARGVATYGGRLVIANAERLLIFDSYWKVRGEITHPWMGGIHDLLAEEDGIWVTCSSADLLLKVDWTGKLVADWEWRRDQSLTTTFGFRQLPRVDRSLDYREPTAMYNDVRNIVHLNAVYRSPDGLLLSFGRILSPRTYKRWKMRKAFGRLARSFGIEKRKRGLLSLTPASQIAGSSSALVLLREDGSTKVLKRMIDISVPNHNVIQVEDVLVYNDSNASQVVATPVAGDHPDRRVQICGAPSFVRGLAQLNKQNFLVGNQAPASVYQVDLEAGRVVSCFLLDGEPNESVYGICLIPKEFKDPPSHLSC